MGIPPMRNNILRLVVKGMPLEGRAGIITLVIYEVNAISIELLQIDRVQRVNTAALRYCGPDISNFYVASVINMCDSDVQAERKSEFNKKSVPCLSFYI